MKTARLGATDIWVSEVALGSYTFGRDVEPEDCAKLVGQYLDAGGNFFDTANVYARGRAEEILGGLLSRYRDNVVLSTKVGLPFGPDDEPTLSRRGITRSLEGSLRRLNTDWVDVYQVHWPDERVAQEETFAALGDLTVAGKIRSVGVSNYTGTKLAQVLAICDRSELPRPSMVEQQYSLLCRDSETELLPLCEAENVAVCAWSPLARGVLAGSTSARAQKTGDATGVSELEPDRLRAIMDAVGEIAEQVGRSRAQVALNWVRQRPAITAPVLGVRTSDQLEDGLAGLEWKLDADQLARLTGLTTPHLPYPHNMYQEIGIHRYV